MPGLTEEAVGALTPVPEAPAGPRRIISRCAPASAERPGPCAIVMDACRHLADDDPLPAEGQVTVSRTRWRAEQAALVARGDVGVRFESDQDPLEDQPLVLALPLIALDFPKFADGRPYSFARKLRRLGFTGQLRATGDVLRDQLLYMWRCGFDAFEVRADKSIEDALAAFDEFSVDYQPNTPRRVGLA